MNTIRSMRAKMRSYTVDNERIIVDQEKSEEVNGIILQIPSNLQRQRQHDLGVNRIGKDKGRKIPLGLGKHELRIDGVEGNRSRKRYKRQVKTP